MPAHVPPVADERNALLGYLAHQRQGVHTAAYGLTDAEAAATPTAGTLSIGALVKHLAQTERWWIALVRDGSAPMDPAGYVEGWRFEASDDLSEVLDDYARCADETDQVIGETARHAGHADVVRESLDGAKAISLLAAAEGWPATEWVQPWQRKGEDR